MPLAIILVALGLIAAGIRGSYKDLFALLVGDFTGQGNFLNWLCAIALVGCLGYVPRLQPFSRAFIGLILVACFIKQGNGLFDKFTQAIQSNSAGTQHPNPGSNPDGPSSSDGSGGGIFGGIGSALGIPSGILSGITSIGSNPLSSLPGATSNPLAKAGGIGGIIGNTPAFNGSVAPNLNTNIIPDVSSGGFMGP